jgi:hypothetical protein
MADTLMAYIGRSNVETLTLEYRPEGEDEFTTVPVTTVLRAVFKFGVYCIDTDEVGDPIELSADATKVHLQLGLIPLLAPGRHRDGKLTIYDAEHPEGLAWADYRVRVESWPVCEVSP